MEVSGQLHSPAALLPGKQPPIPIVYEAGWDPEPVWTLWRRKNVTPAVQPVACGAVNWFFYFFDLNASYMPSLWNSEMYISLCELRTWTELSVRRHTMDRNRVRGHFSSISISGNVVLWSIPAFNMMDDRLCPWRVLYVTVRTFVTLPLPNQQSCLSKVFYWR
jgi:hypothetical protein